MAEHPGQAIEDGADGDRIVRLHRVGQGEGAQTEHRPGTGEPATGEHPDIGCEDGAEGVQAHGRLGIRLACQRQIAL